MPDTTEPTMARYPSRKSLREQAERQHGAPRPVPQDESPSLDPVHSSFAHSSAVDSSAFVDTKPEDQTGSHPPVIQVPRRTHVPQSRVTVATPTPKRTLARRLAGATAGASVCGLLLTVALPFTEHATVIDTTTAAAEQRLFSTAEPPDGALLTSSVSDVDAVESSDSIPSSYSFKPTMLVNYPFTESVLLTDTFGYRTAPVEQFHDAQDFAAAAGTPIHAIANGVVLEAGFATDGCGFGLKLEHEIDGHDVTSRYCHMQIDSHSLEEGDDVAMGDVVGAVGNTGMSFGPHLHLALVLDDEPIDPMPFLAKYNRVDQADASDSKQTDETTPAPPEVIATSEEQNAPQ